MAPNTRLEFLEDISEDESMVAGISLAVSESDHVTLSDVPTLRAALFIARQFDEALPTQRYELARNAGPTLLRYLDALGFTPAGRKALGLPINGATPGSGVGEPAKPSEDKLAALQKKVPGLRVVE